MYDKCKTNHKGKTATQLAEVDTFYSLCRIAFAPYAFSPFYKCVNYINLAGYYVTIFAR
jgi:hypothetical protein